MTKNKKIKLITIIAVLILIALIILPKPSLKVKGVTISIGDIDVNNWPIMYELPENYFKSPIHKNIKYKEVIYSCESFNPSLFKYNELEFRFTDKNQLPNIVVGTVPCYPGLTPLEIKNYSSKNYDIVILIDSKNYTDAEILKKLEKVSIVMVEPRTNKDIVLIGPVFLKPRQ